MLSRRSFVLTSMLAGLSTRLAAQPLAGHYTGELVLKPLDDGRMMQLLEPFAYVDPRGTTWQVPANAVVDGASIPRVFWTIIGGPWEGKYRAASIVHDWFCAVRVMPWKQTHRMFYDAMLTSQVDGKLARLMFLAVRYAGPSWDDLTLKNSRILSNNGTVRLDPPGQKIVSHGFANEKEAVDAKAALLAEFDKLSAEVTSKNLSVDQIEQLVDANGREENVAARLQSL